jgi:hypothetical protein
VHPRGRLPFDSRPALEAEAVARIPAVEREQVDRADRGHAGNGRKPRLEIGKRLPALIRRGIADARDRKRHREATRGVEADRLRQHRGKAAKHEPAADEGECRERHFADDERTAGAAADSGGATTAFLDRLDDVRP